MSVIICRKCKLEQSIENMVLDKRIKQGHTTICKKCSCKDRCKYYRENKRQKQNYDLHRTYGISIDEYDRMSTLQNHRCAICRTLNPGGNKSRFSVDHDHNTGTIRGLLCGTCNLAIGLMKDNLAVLEKAAEYIRTFQEVE